MNFLHVRVQTTASMEEVVHKHRVWCRRSGRCSPDSEGFNFPPQLDGATIQAQSCSQCCRGCGNIPQAGAERANKIKLLSRGHEGFSLSACRTGFSAMCAANYHIISIERRVFHCTELSEPRPSAPAFTASTTLPPPLCLPVHGVSDYTLSHSKSLVSLL